MGKGFARFKEVVINKCLECGEECEIVLVPKSKWTKEQGIPTGKMWRCKNGHMNRTRNYIVEQRRVG